MTFSRRLLIATASIVALVILALAAYSLLPKRYSVAVRLQQVTVFWNSQEAFFFLNTTSAGRTENAVLDRLSKTRYGYWIFFFGGGLRFMDSDTVAFHLLPSGELTQVSVPAKSAAYGEWTLRDGMLRFSPISGISSHLNGFRWDGHKFVSVSPQESEQLRENSVLDPDDERDDDAYPRSMPAAARKAFRDSGWHYKVLNEYETKSNQSMLPMALGNKSFQLSVTNTLGSPSAFDPLQALAGGISRIEVSAANQSAQSQILWANRGWQAISKEQFDDLAGRSGRPTATPYAIWAWALVFAIVTISKLTGWGYLILNWFGVKKRILNNMATAYSFPPATPSQFHQLDTAELERYTREFESYGFVRLLDFSLVPNTAKPIPSFCRVFVHSRHHCFAEVSQIFPPRKHPLPLRCSIQSSLQDGWTLGFSDRKPQAASSLIRRKNAISVSMPGTSTYELLQRFLQMREQICQDLAIAYLKDDTLDAYIAKVQRAAAEMREAVRQKNFATRVPEFYYRKLALLKTDPEYVWLGDYPRQAELRKRGMSSTPLQPV